MLEDGNHGCADVAAQHRPLTADWLAARLAGGPEPVIPHVTTRLTTQLTTEKAG
jgi:hypothetical protein